MNPEKMVLKVVVIFPHRYCWRLIGAQGVICESLAYDDEVDCFKSATSFSKTLKHEPTIIPFSFHEQPKAKAKETKFTKAIYTKRKKK